MDRKPEGSGKPAVAPLHLKCITRHASLWAVYFGLSGDMLEVASW
jgi:hypothetical protein